MCTFFLGGGGGGQVGNKGLYIYIGIYRYGLGFKVEGLGFRFWC